MKDWKDGRVYPPDEICNPNFEELIREYNRILLDDPEAIKKCTALKDKALTTILTERQMAAVIDRCNYQINQTLNPTEKPKDRAKILESIQLTRNTKFSSNGKK